MKSAPRLRQTPAGRPSEEAIHRALVEHLERRRAPGVVWWHTPNGEIRHKGAAGKLKAMGARAGMPDLMLLRAGQLYGVELKRDDGRLSPAQQQRLSELTAAGALTGVAHGIDAALRMLSGWGLIR